MAIGGFGVGGNDGGRDDIPNYPGKVTKYVMGSAAAAAAGGLIFGYDIGISGGVTSMAPFLRKFFPSVYQKEELHTSNNQYCQFDNVLLTMFTSSLYLAALVSCLIASKLTKTFGRRNTMLAGAIIFLAGAALNAAAVAQWMLIVGRLLLGLGIGLANQSVPLYLSEMAPYKYRGSFNVCFQLAITIGIFVANLVNYGFEKISGGWGWRLSLGGAAVPALLIIFTSIFLSDTPNSLLDRGEEEKAKELLKRIRGVESVELEFNDLVAARDASKQVKRPWRNLRMRKYRPQLIMSILIPFFQQFTGINVVMFYAPVLFRTLGFGGTSSLMSAVITGAVNVVATLISVYGTDRWGRRPLFIVGGVIMLVFQIIIAILIGSKFGTSGNVTTLPKGFAIGVVICICCYVSAFAFSWGPLGWLVPSEIFPLEIRSAAQSITVAVNMVCTFSVAQLFLKFLCIMKFGLFLFFAVFVLAMTLFVIIYLPETKNIPIEEMSQVWGKHWYWKRFVEVEGNEKGRSSLQV